MIYNFDEFNSKSWKLLSQVSRPSRYCGCEWNPYEKIMWENAKLKICLAFPDVYEIGMSYYGFQIIEGFIHSMQKNYIVDRVYCPWPDMENIMRENNMPLTSIEYNMPINEFDIFAFTLQHEAGYTNILTMLNLAGTSIKNSERSNNSPLVIAGGYGAYVPEVTSDFIDVFCIGEAEALLPELLPLIESTKGMKREEILQEISRLKGFYVPLFYDGNIIERQITEKFFTLSSMIVPAVNIVHDRAAVELFRGCGRGCRFCQAGMVNRPVREKNIQEAKDSIINILHSTGFEEAGLLSLASCDYSGIENLIENLSRENIKLSLPSLRMDGFSIGLAEKLEGIRAKHGSITFAPEAGTQKLRDVINKGINEEMIINCLKEAFSRGWDRIKLYFMMGLPTEDIEDLEAINEIALNALKIGRSFRKKRISISVSVSGFVPKAHTPFQWERQNNINELREKGRYIKSRNREHSISIAYHEPEQTFLEGVLSRGNKDTCKIILHAWQNGARFDNWTEYFDLSRWLEAFEHFGINPEDYTRERGETEILPWDFVNVGITKDFLIRERHNAYSRKLTPDCYSGCAACGLGCKKCV